MHSDDAAGVHAARMLLRDVRLPEQVAVIEGETLTREIWYYLQHVRHILLLEAIDFGEIPGTLVRLSGKDLLQFEARWSCHHSGAAGMMEALFPARTRREVIVLAIQPASIHHGTRLSASVQAGLGALIDAALEETVYLGGGARSSSPSKNRELAGVGRAAHRKAALERDGS